MAGVKALRQERYWCLSGTTGGSCGPSSRRVSRDGVRGVWGRERLIMSLWAIVKPSTMIIGERGVSPHQPAHLSSPTCFQHCLSKGTRRCSHWCPPTLHTGHGQSILFTLLHPKGAPPPCLGTFQLASHLAAGPRLFGPWRDFPSCSSPSLFMKMTLLHEPPRAVPLVQASVQLSLYLFLQ